MIEAPEVISDARVVAWGIIDSNVIPTGKTIHRNSSEALGPFRRLAICCYKGDGGFYLFYCDDEWQTLADTWHESLNDAIAQAEFEYQGFTAHWRFSHGDETLPGRS